MFICGNRYRCTGCRICETVCSFRHFSMISPSRARIQIKRDDLGADKIISCRQCDEPACVEACPEDALWKGEQLVNFSRDLCTGCYSCIDACPHNGIWSHPELDYPLKCNLCNGNPLCVEMCPADVLKLVKSDEEAEAVWNEPSHGKDLIEAYLARRRDQNE